MKLKSLFCVIHILPIVGYAGGSFEPIEPYTTELIETEEEVFMPKGMFYMYGGMSIVNITSSNINTDTIDSDTLSKKGGIIDIGGKYQFHKNFFGSLGYQHVFLPIAGIDNIYAGINFIPSSMKDAYIGFLIGGSSLTWDKNPDEVLIDKDLTSESLLWGGQIGYSKEIQENTSIGVKYQGIKYNHVLDIRDGRSEVKHNFQNNMLIGVDYEF